MLRKLLGAIGRRSVGESQLLSQSFQNMDACPWYEVHLSQYCVRFRDPRALAVRQNWSAKITGDARPFVNLFSKSQYQFLDSFEYGTTSVYSIYLPIGEDKAKELQLHLNSSMPDLSPRVNFDVYLLTPMGEDFTRFNNLSDPIHSLAWLQKHLRMTASFGYNIQTRVLPDKTIELGFPDEDILNPIVADDAPVPLEECEIAGKMGFYLSSGGVRSRYFLGLGKRDILVFEFGLGSINLQISQPKWFAKLERELILSISISENTNFAKM